MDPGLTGCLLGTIAPIFFNRVGSKLEFSINSVTMQLASGLTKASGTLSSDLNSGSGSNNAQGPSVDPSTFAFCGGLAEEQLAVGVQLHDCMLIHWFLSPCWHGIRHYSQVISGGGCAVRSFSLTHS